MKGSKRHVLPLLFSLLILLISFLLSISLGSVNLSIYEVINGILNADGYEKQSLIIYSLRFPRIFGAIMAGAALSSAGLMLQQATGNDLCAPNIIGVNSGAGLFVMLILCFAPSLYLLIPVSAFLGALIATILVLLISRMTQGASMKATLVLSGVAVGAFFNAVISFLSYLFPDVLVSYTAFSVGSLSGIYSEDIAAPSAIIGVCLILALLLSPRLKLLCLGDSMAASLGVNVRLVRIFALVLSSALCASSVSFGGLIGFVGLIVPHMAKKFVPSDSPLLLPICMTTGAYVLLLSDLLGRILFAPSELPCGIIMSIVGAPFFVFLLCRRRREHD